jgi:hypothetical protein
VHKLLQPTCLVLDEESRALLQEVVSGIAKHCKTPFRLSPQQAQPSGPRGRGCWVAIGVVVVPSWPLALTDDDSPTGLWELALVLGTCVACKAIT